MRVKKIIPLFVVFAMVTSLLSVPAHATYGGGVGRADFFEWTYGLYQSGNTDFNPGGVYGDGVGREELAAAYSTYVSGLPKTTVTQGDCGINWSVFGAEYYESKWDGLEISSSGFSGTYGHYYADYIVCQGFFSVPSSGVYYLGSYSVGSCVCGSTHSCSATLFYKDSSGNWTRISGNSLSSSWECKIWFQVGVNAGTGYHELLFSLPTILNASGEDSFGSFSVDTRPTSISGNYGIIGDDGQLTNIGTQTIVNEGDSTYYNPVTSTTYDLSGWTYDYSTRTYDLSTTSGDTITVEYADESVNITEGDTVYNVYYVVEQEPVDPSTCEHTYTCEHTTLPNCTQAGLDTYTCSLCGDIYTQTVAAAGHSWTVKQSVNTQYDETGALVTEGYTIYECSTCGEQYKSTDGTSPPSGSGSSSGSSGSGGSIWEKLGTLFGTIADGVIGIIETAVGKLLDGLIALAQTIADKGKQVIDLILSFFDEIPGLFGAFPDFLGAIFPFIPEEMMLILEFGLAAVVFVAIFQLIKKR